MNAFSITQQAVDDDVHVIAVTGYLDFDAAPRLKRCIVDCIEAGGRRLVVDLSDAGFIDSTGIGVLAGALKRLREEILGQSPMRKRHTIVGAGAGDEPVLPEEVLDGLRPREENLQQVRVNGEAFGERAESGPDPADHPSALFHHLVWLKHAGFAVVDCFWMHAGHAVYGGFKP